MTGSGSLTRRAAGPDLPPANSSAELRHHHLAQVLWYLREHGPTSRADIARDCGFGVSTMTDLTYELRRRRLIKELPPVPQPNGRAGRPTQPIALDDAAPWTLLGVHVSSLGVTTELTTLSGEPLSERLVDDTPLPADADDLATHLASIVRCGVASIPRDRRLISVGIASSGFAVDEVLRGGADGFPRIGLPVLEWWRATLAAAGLSRVSVTVAGEAQLEALHAVRMIERHPAEQTALYVGGSWSIDGAVIMNHRIEPGDHGSAGRVGHLPVGSGILCACGRRGCLDTVASLPAILASSQAAGAASDGGSAVDWLRDQAASGSAAARSALEAAGEALRLALEAARVTLDPSVVIVGGHLADLWSWLSVSDLDEGFGISVTHLGVAADVVSGAILAAQDACLAEPLTWTSPDAPAAPDAVPAPQQQPVTSPRAEIVKIAVGRDGVRSAVAKSPSDPRRTIRHGLGEVGEPVAPHLGHRVGQDDTGGYELVLPEDRASLYVYQTNPEGRGRAREQRLPWAALGAPDLPDRFALRRERAS